MIVLTQKSIPIGIACNADRNVTKIYPFINPLLFDKIFVEI
jgi:hypothetical protein